MMSIPMFPKEECTTITENVFIHKKGYAETVYNVWFKVGHQYFQIGEYGSETLAEAEWFAKEFARALNTFKDGPTLEEE